MKPCSQNWCIDDDILFLISSHWSSLCSHMQELVCSNNFLVFYSAQCRSSTTGTQGQYYCMTMHLKAAHTTFDGPTIHNSHWNILLMIWMVDDLTTREWGQSFEGHISQVQAVCVYSKRACDRIAVDCVPWCGLGSNLLVVLGLPDTQTFSGCSCQQQSNPISPHATLQFSWLCGLAGGGRGGKNGKSTKIQTMHKCKKIQKYKR